LAGLDPGVIQAGSFLKYFSDLFGADLHAAPRDRSINAPFNAVSLQAMQIAAIGDGLR
jgi:hypothetical protein